MVARGYQAKRATTCISFEANIFSAFFFPGRHFLMSWQKPRQNLATHGSKCSIRQLPGMCTPVQVSEIKHGLSIGLYAVNKLKPFELTCWRCSKGNGQGVLYICIAIQTIPRELRLVLLQVLKI